MRSNASALRSTCRSPTRRCCATGRPLWRHESRLATLEAEIAELTERWEALETIAAQA